jgi:N utilization substance protein B
LSKEGSLDKLETTLQAILQVGVFELISPLETPTEVVINEYVDLTHAFYEKQTVGLVNGVLDKVALLRKQKNLG